MANYRFCAHCQLSFDLDEVELDTCWICTETICPFCAIVSFSGVKICNSSHIIESELSKDEEPESNDYYDYE